MDKTSAAPKKSKSTTAWWPASHWKNMRLAKCQISNEQNLIFPIQILLEALEILVSVSNISSMKSE